MNSDTLELIGIFIAIITLVYAIVDNNNKKKREAKKEKIEVIRKLYKILENSHFNDHIDKKTNDLDKFRDELDFVELTIEESKSILNLNLDDDFYILIYEHCENSFKEQKKILSNKIKNLKTT